MVLWNVVPGASRWVVATPDWQEADGGGVYLEDLVIGADIASIVSLSPSGVRPALDRSIYAFSEDIDDGALVALIERGRREAEKYCSKYPGLDVGVHDEFQAWGQLDLRELPSGRRRRGKAAALPAPVMPVADEERDRTPRPASRAREVPTGPWALAMPVPGLAVGDVVALDEDAHFMVMGDKVLLKMIGGPASGETAVLLRARGLSRGTFRAVLQDQVAEEFDLVARSEQRPPPRPLSMAPERARPSLTEGCQTEPDPDDARILGLDYNKRKQRYKPFADAVAEQVEDHYPDWPLYDGERSLLWVLEKMARDGQAPISWCEGYLARKRYADHDRSQFELRSIAKTLGTALVYDQLNICALASFEHIARRWQVIVSAHARDALNPNYYGAEHFAGTDDVDGCVARALREKVNKGIAASHRSMEAQTKYLEMKSKLPRGGKNPKGKGKGEDAGE